MKLNGAQIVWECLVREGVETVFGITGGKVIPLFHEMRNYPIKQVVMRHEQAAAHAADGFARATGKVGVCIATSGPGATNLITGIANAQMDSSPIVAITGQVSVPELGTDAFQEVDITGISMPVVKHNYLITDINQLAEALRESFYIARSGRPGAVLVDIAVNVQTALTEFIYPETISLPGYKPHTRGSIRQIHQAVDMLAESDKPIIIAGRGVLVAGAQDLLCELSTRANIPVVTTLLGKSLIPDNSPLCLGMGGMHGESYTNMALQNADLILAIGSRFDDRLTSTAGTFAPKARIIHMDIEPAEIGKRIRVDLPIVGDAKDVLEKMLPLVPASSHEAWITQIESWRADTQSREKGWQESNELVPQYVMQALSQATKGEAIVISDVGQNQMWEAQYYQHLRAGGLISSGGLGTMGFALPAAIGVAMGRSDAPVWVVAGDGGFQMTLQELATVVQEKLPIKIALLNNGFLGMVRQWQELFFDHNYEGTPLLGPDFCMLAQAYGIPGFRVESKEDVVSAIEQAIAVKGPALIDFRIEREHNVFPIVPVGKAINEMIRRSGKGDQA